MISNHIPDGSVPSPNGDAIPHAEGTAEAVVGFEDSEIPMAAAFLLDQAPPLPLGDKRLHSNLSENNNNNSTRETIILHDPNRFPNDALSSLETTVMQVEMDGELDQSYADNNATPASATDASTSPTDQRRHGRCCMSVTNKFHNFFSTRKWIKIGMIVAVVLLSLSIMIPIGLMALHDEGEDSSMRLGYSWSIADDGMPPLLSAVSTAGTRNAVITGLEACYLYCDGFAEDDDPILGVAYYFDAVLHLDVSDEPICICYRSIPCVRQAGDRREGVFLSAFPLPGLCSNSTSSYGNTTGKL